LASQTEAREKESAWSKAADPLPANAFTASENPGNEAVTQLNAFAAGDVEDYRGGGIFDEVRLGVLTFWQRNGESEEGIYATGQVLFDPFIGPFDNRILNIILRPRPHLGGNVSPDGTDQIFGGITWTVPIWRLFAEASFGGTIHNGPLSGAEVSLGCRVLFRESIALGLQLGPHWRVVGGIDHSSHAGLCEGENDGLTHVGGSVGYRF
jgi:hypothetical protein